MPTAFITGASSGIGREFAINLSHRGYSLILTSRNKSALDNLAASLNTDCTIIQADLSNENECAYLINEIKNHDIDILINNAGFGEIGSFDKTSLEKEINMINVNIKALHMITKAILPLFIKKDSGFILNVASSAGLLPAGPYMAAYYATKSYVTSLTCAIAHELKQSKSNVNISVLCPGPVNTNFNKTAGVKSALKGISAKKCADYALKKMFRGKLIIVPGIPIKLTVFAARIFPRKIIISMTAKQQSKKFR